MRAFLAAAACGAALALCLPRPGLAAPAWLVLAPLFVLLARARSPRRAAGLFAACGAAFGGVSLHWIYLTCRFALVPAPAALLAWVALAGALSVHWALYGWLGRRLGAASPAVRPWALAALWAGMEWAWDYTPRVPADLLAYTQDSRLSMIQACSLLGPHALSFLIVLWGAVSAALWAAPSGRTERRNAAAALALCALWGGWGAWTLVRRAAPAGNGPWVEILQPNIDQYKKWDERFAAEIRGQIDGLLRLPRPARPDLVLWPEAALPGWLDDPPIRAWVGGWARRLKAPMLVGTVTERGGVARNSAAWIDASGGETGLYSKRQLVPFGEFVPLRRLLQPFIGILGRMGDMEPGPARQPLFALGKTPLAVSLCYEAVFPRWARLDAGRGARVLVNLTNDGWYKDTWGPYQHFRTNVFRAVENRATVLRAANTGISGEIDPYGVVRASTALGVASRFDVRLPAEDPFPLGSFYSRHGDWFGPACLALALGLLLGLGGAKFPNPDNSIGWPGLRGRSSR